MTGMARRTVVAGLAASLLPIRAPTAAAAMPARLFDGTPLAANRVAASFRPVDLALPDVVVLTRTGRLRLPELVGTTRLMTLWAEWCVPRLLEARDLAEQRPRFVDGRFDIVSVLTGSSGHLDYDGAIKRLDASHAAGLNVLVEPDGGHAIAQALSIRPPTPALPPNLPPGARIISTGPGFALPCTLLVDRKGRVRGRATGIAALAPVTVGNTAGVPHAPSEQEKHAMLDQGMRTAWAGPDGLAFLKALRDGALDRS